MTTQCQPVRVAVIGLGFGAEFIPFYQRHPRAEMAAICRRDRAGLDEVGDQFGVARRYTDYRELLEAPDIDAVHINSPIPDHAWMAVEALRPASTSSAQCRNAISCRTASTLFGSPHGLTANCSLRTRRPARS